MSPLLQAADMAKALAAQGISVFPCRGATKRPCTPNGFYDAERDPQKAYALFRSNPGELIGVPTGSANGFDVLDIDPRHGGDVWETANEDRGLSTKTHQSRSGGRHYLFQHHPRMRNTESKIAPGVDTRGEGGYVIWWPAHGCPISAARPINAWPDWLLQILLPPPEPTRQSIARTSPITCDASIRRIIARTLDRVASATAGERHYRLRAASRTLGGLLDVAGVPRATIARDLLGAVVQAGGSDVDKKNAEATIEWGLDQGAKLPLTIGGRNAR